MREPRSALVRRARMLVAVAAVAGVVALAGCGGGGSDAEARGEASTSTVAPTTTEAPTTTTTEPPSDEAAVLAAYEGYWDAIAVANDPPNPDEPRLGMVMTGELLQSVRDKTQQNADLGYVLRRPRPSQFSISDVRISVAGEDATLAACVVDDGQVVQQKTGLVLNDRVTSGHVDVGLRREAGSWKVVNHVYLDKREGASACVVG